MRASTNSANAKHPRVRWERTINMTRRLMGEKTFDDEDEVPDLEEERKKMEAQYWLELIDP